MKSCKWGGTYGAHYAIWLGEKVTFLRSLSLNLYID